MNKFSDEEFIQPRICVEVSQILLIAEQNLKFCSRPQRKTLRNGGTNESIVGVQYYAAGNCQKA